ncbi:MAG TPA: hypothetical protein VK082_02060 [Paenalcaligenes sp.]|nr:hypothetical protein [Paenalcaligenes sp.]
MFYLFPWLSNRDLFRYTHLALAAIFAFSIMGIYTPVWADSDYYPDYDLSAPPPYKEQSTPHTDSQNINLDSATSGDWRYKTSQGFYVGNDFTIGQYGRAAMQVDTIAGYSRSLGAHTGLKVGYNHSLYPNEGRLNRNKVFANLSYRNLSLEVSHGLRTGVNKNHNQYNLDYVHPLNTKWSIAVGMGYEHYGTVGPKSTIDYRADVLYRLNSVRAMSIYFGGATQQSPVDDGIQDNRFMFGANMDF